jgi:hypothetical protein
MSRMCRKCAAELPKDRVGWKQLCPTCWEKWYEKYMGIKIEEHHERQETQNSIKNTNI